MIRTSNRGGFARMARVSASGPIQLRLILQPTLTCEVSDTSSTAPRRRRARTFDEGGRSLMPVARLTERWSTRYSREGTVIWAVQALTSDDGERRRP